MMQALPRLPIIAATLLVAVLLLCSACSAPSTSEPQVPNGTISSPLASPIQLTPTHVSGSGSVTGKLFLKGTPNKAVSNVHLYLGGTVKSTTGVESGASVDRINSPRTVTSADGSFIFHNVPTGRYALIIDQVVDAYMLNDPQTGNDMVIIVEVEKTFDLGTLVYSELPKQP